MRLSTTIFGSDKCKEQNGVVLQGSEIPPEPPHPNCKCGFCKMDTNTVAEMVLTGRIVVVNGKLVFSTGPSVDALPPTFDSAINDKSSDLITEKSNPLLDFLNNLFKAVNDVAKVIFPWS